ncbi:macro domain-containing protein [Candidatus Micrarchaeota archaeon]|nr:macro domain-containing protein [Candidatus Micrarchaeota archaeon]MBU1930124.1 macro domain-containing protein [Candidatus Micrarchaeota archaeon]
MDVIIIEGDIATFSVDAIFNAASTSLEMDGGVALAIRKAAGKEVEEEVLESAPSELGQAIATSAGKLDAKFVIHVASVKPGEQATEENIRTSFRNALELADSLECETIAVPAIGCGVGGFSLQDGARVLLSEIKEFKSSFLKGIFFVLVSQENRDVFIQKAKELELSLTVRKEFEERLKEEEKKKEGERLQREKEKEEKIVETDDGIEEQEKKESDSQVA